VTDEEQLIVFKLSFYFAHRERQDTDGQMKELQDQLEAEQYFSVSNRYNKYTSCTQFVVISWLETAHFLCIY